MRPFAFSRAADIPTAVAATAQPGTALIAGGTELVNWMKEGIVVPTRLVDINGLTELAAIDADPRGLRIGALARMSEVAEHEAVRRDFPAIAEALERSASPQLSRCAVSVVVPAPAAVYVAVTDPHPLPGIAERHDASVAGVGPTSTRSTAVSAGAARAQ